MKKREKGPSSERGQSVLPATAEQLAAVQTFFGLRKSQLAESCRVERQTIYDWYSGELEAVGDTARRLAELYKIVEEMKNAGGSPLSHRMVELALSSGCNLLELLGRAEIDQIELGAVVARLDEEGARERARGAAAIQERLGWQAPSRETSDEILEGSLEGFVDG